MHVLCANFFYENAEIVIQNLKATQQRLMEYARFGISTAKARMIWLIKKFFLRALNESEEKL